MGLFKLFNLFLLLEICFLNTEAQSLLQNLPKINDPSFSFLQSTYDRTGLNVDAIQNYTSNYYEVIPQGKVNNPNGTDNGKKEYVICKINGPAILERFWMVTYPYFLTARLRFYFDGESIPRINKTFNELFLAQNPPFVKPLVQNIYESSGGFWSYMQIPVAKSLIVTVDTAALFSQFNVRQLARDTIVQSYTLAQDNSFLINEFNKSGTYPKNNSGQLSKDSFNVNLGPGQNIELFSKSGNFIIDGIQLKLPQLDYSYSAFIKDNGKFHKGTSKFTLKINGSADSVLLIKRSNKSYNLKFNFRSLSENLSVLVDNQNAGSWKNSKYRTYRYWENDTFKIPGNLYQNKSQLTLQVKYTGGEACNEYYYWISCNNIITDSVDVGTAGSEAAHSYSVTNLQATLVNEINNRYNSPKSVKQKNKQILDSVYISIFFDDESVPSVNAPLGLFFAAGVNDAAYMKSIPCGNINGEFYNYFSMPFWRNTRIVLENKSHRQLNNITANILTSVNNYNKEEAGYFKTFYNKDLKTFTDSTDYLVANINGRGRYVGTVIEAEQVSDTFFCWLEGDEHIYLDDAKTPVFIGTGTEDYFNSTFYFFLDEYSLQQNGMTNSDDFYHKSMYRFHLTDPINFNKNIAFKIEHGDYNNKLGIYHSLAFVYVINSKSILTDSLDVGDNNSEQIHQYLTPSNKILLNKNSSFEGEKFRFKFRENGYAVTDSSEFTVNINANNKGVRLLRLFDYAYRNQEAKVFVDDSLVGNWLNAGFNDTCSLREEYFVIPAKFTYQKSNLKIKCVNVNPNSKWTELNYKVYSVTDSSVVTFIKEQKKVSYKIYPNLTNDKINIETDNLSVSSIMLFNQAGKLLKTVNHHQSGLTTLDLAGFASGTYFIAILQQDKIVKTEKVILVH